MNLPPFDHYCMNVLHEAVFFVNPHILKHDFFPSLTTRYEKKKKIRLEFFFFFIIIIKRPP